MSDLNVIIASAAWMHVASIIACRSDTVFTALSAIALNADFESILPLCFKNYQHGDPFCALETNEMRAYIASIHDGLCLATVSPKTAEILLNLHFKDLSNQYGSKILFHFRRNAGTRG